MRKNAVILGVTGLVGNFCLEKLHAKQLYGRITAVTRKAIKPAILGVENAVINFNEMSRFKQELTGDHAFCAFGTTIGKAGSKEAFRKVDFSYILEFAQIVKANGASKFILVSAIGATTNSPFFYSKVKGELEEALEKIGFESLIILQPSLLLGKRKEVRIGEIIGNGVSLVANFALWGPLQKYKAIKAEDVAEAMIHYANKPTPKVLRLTYEQMVSLN